MSAIRYQPRYTIEDYLGWKGDWELWDGIPVAMSPSPGLPHGRAAFALARLLGNQFEGNDACGHCSIVLEIDWQVDAHTVVRPDVSVLCDKADTQFIETAPTLIAELLSPSTREKDLTVKKALYAEQGVAFYVIGDPDTKELTVLQLVGESYVEVDDATIDLHDDCRISIDAGKVFA